MKRKNRIFTKGHIVLFIILMFGVLYVMAYREALRKEKKPQVKYHYTGNVVEYGGYEYIFKDAVMYDKNGILDNYGIDVSTLSTFCMGMGQKSYDVRYIVTEIHARRVDEDVTPPDYYDMESRYIHCGPEEELKRLINKQDYKEVEELEIGEETMWYEVAYISNVNLDKDLWKKCEKQTFYIQLMDYAGHEYVDRIRVLN